MLTVGRWSGERCCPKARQTIDPHHSSSLYYARESKHILVLQDDPQKALYVPQIGRPVGQCRGLLAVLMAVLDLIHMDREDGSAGGPS